ncbi:hypothetical protein ACFVS2_22000 [Brevibacillus sp. NPDC058079]|uniref:hypothetical protein n=1 Tax=Brevibacillus sp. NPDC058079 TaxID=3346330 RepID=UPI0036E277C5
MEKGGLLGLTCLVFEVSSRMLSKKHLEIKEYSGNNLDLGIPQGNGRFKLVKEDEIIREYLNKGLGIYLRGKVYFAESVIDTSESYKKFKREFDKSHEKIEKKCVTFAEGYLLNEVSSHQIPIINSITSLYETGLFTGEKMLEKLSAYLSEEQIAYFLHLRSMEKQVKQDSNDQAVA